MTARPPDRPERYDLEAAAKAAAAEAGDEPFRFDYKGGSYEFPPSRSWPVAVYDQLGNGNLPAALPLLLGADAYQDLTGKGLTIGEIERLFEDVAKAFGLETLPNSSPPARRGSRRK